ncbi:hypothetical protein ACVW0Y_001477 [Pseudomonas sp. TE3786]
MNSKLRITAVEPAPASQALRITWNDGRVLGVNLAELIRTFSVLAPLQDAELFRQVQVGEWGFDLVWPGDIELAAATLYRLALEQAGEAMPKGAFKEWMQRHGLSLTGAAEALHLTRRTITAYSSGPNPIPYHIALACMGWEVLQGKRISAAVSEERGGYEIDRAASEGRSPGGKSAPVVRAKRKG